MNFNNCFSVSLICLLHSIQCPPFVSFSLRIHIFKLPIDLGTGIDKLMMCLCIDITGDKSASMVERFLGVVIGCLNGEGARSLRRSWRNLWLCYFPTNRSRLSLDNFVNQGLLWCTPNDIRHIPLVQLLPVISAAISRYWNSFFMSRAAMSPHVFFMFVA